MSNETIIAGINAQMRAVEEFHERNAVSSKQRLSDCPDDREVRIKLFEAYLLCKQAGELLLDCSKSDDRRGLRAHLLSEELGEFILAIFERDEVAALDALADLDYVLKGSAVTFDLPLAEAFIEVHKSNMTKTKQPTDPHAQRLRSKGPDYVPPDITGVLAASCGRIIENGMYALRDRLEALGTSGAWLIKPSKVSAWAFNVKCPCERCNDTGTSGVLSLAHDSYHCASCGTHGVVKDFVTAMDRHLIEEQCATRQCPGCGCALTTMQTCPRCATQGAKVT